MRTLFCLVLASAFAVVPDTAVSRPTRSQSSDWERLVGCWQSADGWSAKWIRGDPQVLFGASWKLDGTDNPKVARLTFGDSTAMLEEVSVGKGTISHRSVRETDLLNTVTYARSNCEGPLPVTADVARGLQQLHQSDISAVRRSDANALVALWTNGVVAMPPGTPAVIGSEANAKSLRENLERSRNIAKPTDYALIFDTIIIVGEDAIEFGRYKGKASLIASGQTVEYAGRMLRVAARQPDGSYRIAVTMFGASDID